MTGLKKIPGGLASLAMMSLFIADSVRANESSPAGTNSVLLFIDTHLSETSPPPALTKAADRWSSFLPIFGDQARNRGYAVPLPFGVSANFFYCQRDVDVKSVSVSANNGPFQSVDQFTSFKVKTQILSSGGRFDFWLFPFLNLYGMGGDIQNESHIKVNLINPTSGISSLLIDQKAHFEGTFYGGGATIAGGYRQFFATLDVNYSIADLGFAENVTALIATPRVGWNGVVHSMPIRVWVGASYWDTERRIKGEIEVPGGGNLRYDVLQGPQNPWNMELGANLQMTPHWAVALDTGFNFKDMLSCAVNVSYRF